MKNSSYSWIDKYISKSSISSIVEVGARDCIDTIKLVNQYKCPILSFEPVPSNIVICKNNLNSQKSQFTHLITFFDFALSDKNEKIPFFMIDETKYDNIGAGSFYEIDFACRQKSDPDYNKQSIQKKIFIETKKFSSLNYPSPTILLMDVQGAELKVIKGFENLLKKIKYIVFETCHRSTYKNGQSFELMNIFLKK